ncbi:MAG: DNA phosphorothioation-associated putative methyltransferase [Rivularia sp. T60_A2020_040]|nr:DNA phosphorothioation-associated putative methyltransferase [Rivularia sp. T60_A2020_040]
MLEDLAIERHRAAMFRTDLSRPIKLAVEFEIINTKTTFFDYGCGHGGDVKRLSSMEVNSAGWDPYYKPDTPLISADVVNLGYILNVIEDTEERLESLQKAWKLTNKVLIVAAQVLVSSISSKNQLAYGDGVVTSRNTFQKYYEQGELKKYIDSALEVDAVPVALGIYFVFRDEQEKENFRAEWYRSGVIAPRIRLATKKYEDCKQELEPLIQFYTKRGRLPAPGELEPEVEENILLEFASIRRAFKVILQATDEAEWDAIAYRRSLDIQVYLALVQFEEERPRFLELPEKIRHDIKAFFGTYRDACEVADEKLFSLGESKVIKAACKTSKIGKQTPDALYVHITALGELEPLLRIYEGCASRVFGRPEETTIVKLHINQPRISYLYYPDFDTDAHPALKASIVIDLKTFRIARGDYSKRKNPPILHRKETFVSPQYPQYEEFARLTEQEVELGLYENPSHIGTRNGWQKYLEQRCIEIRGHQLFEFEHDITPHASLEN